MHERQLTLRNVNDVARRQRTVADHPLIAHRRPVATVQIADRPLAIGQEHLRVIPAGSIILHNNLVGGGPTDRDRPTRNEPEYVGPFRTFTDDQISQHLYQLILTHRACSSHNPHISPATRPFPNLNRDRMLLAFEGGQGYCGKELARSRRPVSARRVRTGGLPDHCV